MKIKRFLNLFLTGRITLSKAASLAKVDIWRLMDIVREEKIAWIKDKRFIEQDLKNKL